MITIKLQSTSTLPTYMHICAFSRDMAFPQVAALAKVLASENDDPERRFSPSLSAYACVNLYAALCLPFYMRYYTCQSAVICVIYFECSVCVCVCVCVQRNSGCSSTGITGRQQYICLPLSVCLSFCLSVCLSLSLH
jgi:hypothetical protein